MSFDPKRLAGPDTPSTQNARAADLLSAGNPYAMEMYGLT